MGKGQLTPGWGWGAQAQATHLLVPATDHAAHGEAHAPVLEHHVGKQLGGCRHGDALPIPQIVQPRGGGRRLQERQDRVVEMTACKVCTGTMMGE